MAYTSQLIYKFYAVVKSVLAASALAGTAGGFNTNMTILEHDPPDPESSAAGPWAVLSFGQETINRNDQHGPTADCYLTLQVDGYFWKTSDLTSGYLSLLMDVREAIRLAFVAVAADKTGLYAGYIDWSFGNIEPGEGQLRTIDGMVKFTQLLTVHYAKKGSWL